MAERSFVSEIEDLRKGEGDVFTGEGILAITKALLECGVGYVGGYQGAPISHLIPTNVVLGCPCGRPSTCHPYQFFACQADHLQNLTSRSIYPSVFLNMTALSVTSVLLAFFSNGNHGVVDCLSRT